MEGQSPGPLAVTCTVTGDIIKSFITQSLGSIANGTDISLDCKEERFWGTVRDPFGSVNLEGKG